MKMKTRQKTRWLTRIEFLQYTARQDETDIETVLKTYDVQQCPCKDGRCLGWKLKTPTQGQLF